MNFGDILDEWEKAHPPAGDRPLPRGNGEPLPEPPPAASPLAEWLRVNPIQDKDAGTPAGRGAPGERRRRLLNKKPDAAIDLHGLTRNEAWDALESFFRDSRRQRLEKVLVIHGKGNHSTGEGLLKDLSRQFIESCPFAGESGHNPAAGGGAGATWVLLKE